MIHQILITESGNKETHFLQQHIFKSSKTCQDKWSVCMSQEETLPITCKIVRDWLPLSGDYHVFQLSRSDSLSRKL